MPCVVAEIYKDNDGVFINSNLNGSANIGRKAFPELFVGNGREPDFTRVTTIIHPDYESAKELHTHQTEQPHVTSKAKTRRLNKKAACASCAGSGSRTATCAKSMRSWGSACSPPSKAPMGKIAIQNQSHELANSRF